ncbi:hypothetical protein [Ktedonobacter robiniae]|uniref:Uncharacterized protein n=1 Tax=Ktedonobacter robiniae TaxID=2778365 RepID=A0ABQ3UJJ3_9CHLR|nr:hypothetical protein [Ktedonobacter robiniae]GHO52894.1 hypothetical protein KSB_13690 [Ktedonobacter robiniae]
MSYAYDEHVDYQWIKQTAKAQGISVNDLIVLAPQNDPFYTGTPSDQALGQWFAQLWHHFGYDRAHIRRIHYQIISQDPPIVLPNGKPYENTMECWDVLNLASKAARYLQLVDPAAFNDRRTPEVMLYASSETGDPRVGVYGSLYQSDTKLPDFPDLPRYSVSGFKGEQNYHLEVWCEKSTMNDVLAPLCQNYQANLQTGMGEMSITATLALVHRLQQANKPARILYVSDFDPAGQSMPVAVSRKIEYFVRTLGLDLDIRLFPVVLTLEQVQYYQLPRTPIKETERRRVGFEARHGEGAVELDALEALYPGTLQQVLAGYMESYYDTTLGDRVWQQYEALTERLREHQDQVIQPYAYYVADLRAEYEQIRAEFEQRMESYSARLRSLWQSIQGEMRQLPAWLGEYPIPQAYQGQEIGEGLYNSERAYIEQVEAYKLFQGRL